MTPECALANRFAAVSRQQNSPLRNVVVTQLKQRKQPPKRLISTRGATVRALRRTSTRTLLVRQQARCRPYRPNQQPVTRKRRDRVNCTQRSGPGLIPNAASPAAPARAPFPRPALAALRSRRDRSPRAVMPPRARRRHCQKLRHAARRRQNHKLPRRARYVARSRSRRVCPNGSAR